MDKQKLKSSLRLKISLVVTLLMLLFGSLVVYGVGQMITRTMTADKKAVIQLSLTEQTRGTKKLFDLAKASANTVVGIPEIGNYLESLEQKPQDEKILKLLKDFSLGRQLSALYILNSKGVALVSTDPSFVGIDYNFRTYAQKALGGQEYTEMAIGSVSKLPGFYFSAPVKKSDGKIIGAVVAKLDTVPVFADLDTSGVKNFGDIMFVNGDGVIIYSSKKEFLYKSLAPLSNIVLEEITRSKRYAGLEITPLDYGEVLDQVVRREESSIIMEITDDIDKEIELVALKKIGNFPYYLMSESSKDEIVAVVNGVSIIAGGMILVAIILAALSQYIFLSWIMSPLAKLEKYAESVSGGNLEATVEIKTGDELQSLSESIQEMVKSIKKIYSDLDVQVKEKTAELSASLTKNEEKTLDLESSKKAILNVMEDLGEEKDKIATEKNRVETILRSIGDGVFVTDTDGRVVLANHAAERIVGLSDIELYGKKYDQVFSFLDEDNAEKAYPDFVGEAMKEGRVKSLLPHTILVRKDGTKVPVLDTAAPLRTLDGKVFGCVVVFRDNTKERDLERSKDDFISVASHQLRTPLGSMRWNVEMLLGGDVGDLNKEATEVAKQIYDGNLRMIGLVNDLLDVSRIDRGRVMNEPVDTNLGDVLKEAIAEVRPLLQPKKLKIETKIDNKVPKIKIDRKRFREVMENLISNAVKYNKVGGQVKISLKEVKKGIEIAVADTGIGIPKKDQASLFSKFFRATNAVHSETEGSGLGLYVVKKFVDGWGGTLQVESEQGKGSRFIITIPNKNV